MHGNVSKWVLDNYAADRYQILAAAGMAVKNPLQVPTRVRYPYVIRGGGYDDDPDWCRSAYSDRSTPKLWEDDPTESIWFNTSRWSPGFRVVRPLRRPMLEEMKLYEPRQEMRREYYYQ